MIRTWTSPGGSQFSILEQAVFSSGLLFSLKISAAQSTLHTDIPRLLQRKENILKSYFRIFSAYILSGNINAKFWLFWLLKIWCVSTGPLECHVGQTDPQLTQPLQSRVFPYGNTVAASGLVSASLSLKNKQTTDINRKNPPELRTCYITQSKASQTSLYQEGIEGIKAGIPRRSSSRNQCEIGLLL